MAVIGPPRLAPVRPARHRRPEPRPGPARTDRRVPAGVDRRAAVRRARRCSRPTTRASRSLPTAELPWYRVTWDGSRERHEADDASTSTPPSSTELLEPDPARRAAGPVDVEPRAAIDWYWRPTNQVRAVLEALAEAGILGLARRDGNRRVYDLAERLFPADAARRRAARDAASSTATSCCRATARTGCSGGRAVPSCGSGPRRRSARRGGRAGRRAELLRRAGGGWRARAGCRRGRPRRAVRARRGAADVARGGRRGAPRAAGRRAFLAPLDPLVWDRDLLRSLYGFDYVWEVYVPAREASLGLLRAADPLRGPPRRADRAADRSPGGRPARPQVCGGSPGSTRSPRPAASVDAFTTALDAHRTFADLSGVVFERPQALRGLVGEVRARLGPSRAGRPARAAVGR